MPCYHPVKGYIIHNGDKRKFVPCKNQKQPTYEGNPKMEVPCGQCFGCKLEKSRQWATRIIKEQKNSEDNIFITLTYNEANLPKHGNLSVTKYTPNGKQIDSHFQKFMKDLRYHFSERKRNPETGRMKRYYKKIKFFQCGEYGDKNSRPHHHAILFNVDFPLYDKQNKVDKTLWKRTHSGELLYRSKTLEKLWPYGHSSIGKVTFESAAYVARYVCKKITGDKADQHYKVITGFDIETGEITDSIQLNPEYATMSRNPGIGTTHYDKYKNDMFPSDEISILRDGETKNSKVPRFYMDKLKLDNPTMHKQLKEKRIKAAEKQTLNGEYTRHRLTTKEAIKLAQTKNLHRHFEEFH